MNPERFGEMFARWMATADGCACGNNQAPDMCIPSNEPGMSYRCHYRCDDCGQTWTRAYPPTRKEVSHV